MKIKEYIKKICYFTVFFSALMNFIFPLFGIFPALKIVLVLCDIVVIIYTCLNLKNLFRNKYIKVLALIVISLLGVALVSFIINGYSFVLLFLGLWNTFRFFFYFFAVYLVLEKSDIETLLKIEDVLFLINVAVVLFEFAIMGLRRDYISGTFAFMEKGGNAGLMVLCIIELCVLINSFLQKKISVLKLVIYLVPILGIAAIAELKVLFIFSVIVIIIAVILNEKGKRTVGIIVGGALSIFLGIGLLINFYPEWRNTFSFSGIYNILFSNEFGYSSANDISRGRAFAQIDDIFYIDKPLNKMFGFGVGGCDSSNFLNIHSDCYLEYEEVLHYDWFTHSMIYLEMGVFGFVLFLAFFVCNAINSYLIAHKLKDKKYKAFMYGAFCFSVFCVLSIWYDSFLRINYAYFAYAFMALPYIYSNSIKNKTLEEK